MAIDVEFLKSIGIDDEALAKQLIDKTTEDESGLLNKRDELLGKVTTYKDQLKGFEGVDAEEYRELKARIDKINEAEMLDKGEFDKIRAKMNEEWDKERGTLTEQNKTLLSQLESMMVDSEVTKAVAEAKGNLTLLTPVLKQRIKVVDNDGKFVVKVNEQNGDPMVNAKGESVSISELVESLKKNEAYAGAFDSSGLSGGGAKPNGDESGGANDDKLFGSKRLAAARNKSG